MSGKRILVADDEPKLTRLLAESLAGEDREVVTARTAEEAWRLFDDGGADLVVTDLRMETEEAGLDLLRRIQSARPGTPTILMTAFATIKAGVRALELGAVEYLVKPVRFRALRETVDRLLAEREAPAPAPAGDLPHTFDDILVGTHSGMRRIYELLPRVVASNSNVLVIGESGTGKEVIARAIHAASPRAGGPFVRVNCAALVETLLESELFGIEKGVATDVAARPGKFEQAAGGTILLDEIGDMAPGTQAKVLRVLQEREFERVGGSRTIKVDLRVIAATHRDLDAMVAAGAFRQDLYYRLNVIRLELPPLRERLDDLELYARYFLQRLAKRSGVTAKALAPEALSQLRKHAWPGNMRELENVLERALVLSTGERIGTADLPPLGEPGGAAAGVDHLFSLPAGGISLEALERDLLVQAMERSGGNKSAAARLLGLTRRTLGYRLQKHGLVDAAADGTEAETDGNAGGGPPPATKRARGAARGGERKAGGAARKGRRGT
ncbi:MAG: sigma-54-dependent Fis family transcriptional regulator [Candidatus Krumholzibacteriota bacterium]|nr:sigma-54-dependent Fis family transcriptional regulator [Candidatus Krumholzibacteriota bacterium]